MGLFSGKGSSGKESRVLAAQKAACKAQKHGACVKAIERQEKRLPAGKGKGK